MIFNEYDCTVPKKQVWILGNRHKLEIGFTKLVDQGKTPLKITPKLTSVANDFAHLSPSTIASNNNQGI